MVWLRGVLLLALAVLVAVPALDASGDRDTASEVRAPLTADEVADNLTRRNAERAQKLLRLDGVRDYHLSYTGFPGNHDAEMQVQSCYVSPSSKQFVVVSTKGSKFVVEHVFRRLLEGEQEAAQPENQKLTALGRDNYQFTLVGYEKDANGSTYILQVEPKSKNKFLYRGKIWVDGRDFAVKRIEAEPAHSPSFWTKKSEIVQEYGKFGEFWLPLRNQSISYIRLGGKATLTIEYRNYQYVARTSDVTGQTAEQTHAVAGNRN
jgi:hypothetical protein